MTWRFRVADGRPGITKGLRRLQFGEGAFLPTTMCKVVRARTRMLKPIRTSAREHNQERERTSLWA